VTPLYCELRDLGPRRVFFAGATGRAFPGSMAWVTYFSAVAPGMSLVEKQWLVHGAHTSALQRLVLGPRLEAFSLPPGKLIDILFRNSMLSV